METQQIINSFGPMTMALLVLIFGLLNTGLFIISEKWGVISYYERHRRRWMPKRCEFCLFFWLALVELIVWAYMFSVAPVDMMVLVMDVGLAICTAVASRFFLR